MVTMDTAISTMVDRIVGGFHPARVMLFGSQARGDARPDSDVDLLVVMENGADRRRIAIEMMRCLSDLTVPKDIVVTTPDEIESRGHLAGTVLRSALREGRVIYDRS